MREFDIIGGQQTGQDADRFATGLVDTPDDDLARKILKDKADDMSMVNEQRAKMKIDHAFYHDHQWDDADRLRMEQAKRPALVFNRLKATVNAISGLERLNRMSVRYVTRALDSEMDEDMMGELATEARDTVLELCSGEQARSRAILDCAIGGLGVCEIRNDYGTDLDGRIDLCRVNPFEYGWDCNAVAENLSDAIRMWRERPISRKMFRTLYGEDKLRMVEASVPEWDGHKVDKYELVTPYYSRANERANPQVGDAMQTMKTIPVLQWQWKDFQPVYRFLDPANPDRLTDMDEEQWNRLKHKYDLLGRGAPPAVRQMKPIMQQMFCARGVILDGPTPIPGNAFTFLPITGLYDTESKTWYGIIRPLIGPQQTRNKAISSALNFSITNAKGGVMFKAKAFADPIQAKEQWSQPNAWIQLNDEADAQADIVQRQPTPQPVELGQFFAISTQEISGISGINDDVIGASQGEVSSPTTSKRVQGALAVLGWFFDAIEHHMRSEARVMLEFIREFWTRGQLIQVGGRINGKAIPLLRSSLPMDYELVLDTSVKHNPNLKAQVWNDLLPIIPSFLRFGFAPFLLEILKFSPYPAQLVEKLQKMAQQMPPQQQGKGKGKQTDPMETQAKVLKMSADREKTLAQAREVDSNAKLRLAEIATEAIATGAKIRHQDALAEHKKRSDAIKLMQVMKGKGQGGGDPPHGKQ